jgi:hypothetical protein
VRLGAGCRRETIGEQWRVFWEGSGIEKSSVSRQLAAAVDQPPRWTATGLSEAEKKFRGIKGCQEILLLKERLNPSRLAQKRVRSVEVG